MAAVAPQVQPAAPRAAAVRPAQWVVAQLAALEQMLVAWLAVELPAEPEQTAACRAAPPVVAAPKVVDPQAAAVPKVAAVECKAVVLRAAVVLQAGPALRVAVPRAVVVSHRPGAELPAVAARTARKAAVRKVVVAAVVAV